MTTYVYKSTTGFPVNIDNYIITPNPGLYSKYQIEALDTFIGSTLSRYDDGVLVTADSNLPVTASIDGLSVVTMKAGNIDIGISNYLPSIESAGSGTTNAAPAFVRSIGASTTVAAAMEAFSAAMPKGGRTSTPIVVEQGVIRLDARTYTLEKALNIDISSASDSRFGLTIEGTGQAQTQLYVPPTAAPANFRDPFGDGIWRALRIRGSTAGLTNEVRLRNFRVTSYATQGGDGTTALVDPCRWIDLDYCIESLLSDLTVYSRTLSPLSLNQYQFSLSKCYYTQLINLHSAVFGSTQTAATINGGTAARRCGVGFRFENNNALTGSNLVSLGANLSFHLIDEDGLTLVGGASENHNKAFLFDGDSSANKVLNHRAEYSQWGNIVPMESSTETYFAQFTEDTFDNYVENYQSSTCPGELRLDYSATQSNRVTTSDTVARTQNTNLLAAAAWTNSAGVSTASNGDVPSSLNRAITTSTEVTYTGSYNQYRQVTAAVAVDPNWGSVTMRAYHKRVSGMGTITGQCLSVAGATNLGVSGSLLQTARNGSWVAAGSSGLPLATSGHSWSSGKLTMVFKRPHGLQAGMRVQSAASWGSLGAGTNLYVESTPTPLSAILVAASGGTIADPGAITSPANMTIPSDMQAWLNAPNIEGNWQEFVKRIQLRRKCTGLALSGGNVPVITGGAAMALATGVKVRLSSFADSRLNVDYTIVGGDVSGNNLTLSGLGAIPDLVMTQTSKNLVGNAFFGWIGLQEIAPEFRCVTTNSTINTVHRIAGEAMYAGSQTVLAD